MFTYDCVLAAVLLTAPPNAYAAENLEGWLEPLRPALVSLAVNQEILDEREVPNRLANAQDFAEDLELLQTRFAGLMNAPYLEECRRFPESELAGQFLTFNEAYHRDLSAQLVFDLLHADEIRSALLETEQLHRIWEALRDARNEFYYVGVRRQSLRSLRDMMGLEAFYTGQLPPQVPVWRLPRKQ